LNIFGELRDYWLE